MHNARAPRVRSSNWWRWLRLHNACSGQASEKLTRKQNAGRLGRAPPQRLVTRDQDRGRGLLQQSPQMVVAGVGQRRGRGRGIPQGPVQGELSQNHLHLGVAEAVTPADSRSKENLTVLGQEIERKQEGKAPAQHGVKDHGGGQLAARRQVSAPLRRGSVEPRRCVLSFATMKLMGFS
jgi:hypothetical protein